MELKFCPTNSNLSSLALAPVSPSANGQNERRTSGQLNCTKGSGSICLLNQCNWLPIARSPARLASGAGEKKPAPRFSPLISPYTCKTNSYTNNDLLLSGPFLLRHHRRANVNPWRNKREVSTSSGELRLYIYLWVKSEARIWRAIALSCRSVGRSVVVMVMQRGEPTQWRRTSGGRIEKQPVECRPVRLANRSMRCWPGARACSSERSRERERKRECT